MRLLRRVHVGGVAFDLQNDNRIQLISVRRGHRDRDPLIGLLDGECATRQQPAFDNPAFDRRQGDRVACPLEDMEVDLVSFVRGDAPRARPERSAARAIDTLAVLLQPRADFLEPLDLARFEERPLSEWKPGS